MAPTIPRLSGRLRGVSRCGGSWAPIP
jgi:hypothetical protein